MERLLLDTHAFLWCLSETGRLRTASRAAIEDPRNQIFVSAISAWEITVKRLKGKMEAPDDLAVLVDEKGFAHLPLTFHHAELAARLPRLHKDPFDRFLIAQAQAEGLTVVTRDAHFPLYGVRTVRA
ncbi:MAG: type II toxin-antitoxin system VapC family toxin [Acidobacteriota bacterium]|nr:type II toxin-antitoxin system VapC family toxin [Acidobacteriota bacterium]